MKYYICVGRFWTRDRQANDNVWVSTIHSMLLDSLSSNTHDTLARLLRLIGPPPKPLTIQLLLLAAAGGRCFVISSYLLPGPGFWQQETINPVRCWQWTLAINAFFCGSAFVASKATHLPGVWPPPLPQKWIVRAPIRQKHIFHFFLPHSLLDNFSCSVIHLMI